MKRTALSFDFMTAKGFIISHRTWKMSNNIFLLNWKQLRTFFRCYSGSTWFFNHLLTASEYSIFSNKGGSHLQNVGEDFDGAEGDPHSVDGVHERLDEMRRRLEHVRPDEVHQVRERVLAAEAVDAQRHVLDGGAGGLPVNQVPEEKKKSHF